MTPKRARTRETTGYRYTCTYCGHRTVHLMQMVQHGIVAHGLDLTKRGTR